MTSDKPFKGKKKIKILEERTKENISDSAPNLLPYITCISHDDASGRLNQINH